MTFSPDKPVGSNQFIRNSPGMLEGIFGTTDVTPFWVADMDFTVAEPVQAELQRLASRGQFAYEFNSDGVFQAISDWFQRRHNLRLGTDKFVQVTGVLTGISLLIRELTSPGDAVLIQTPAYHQFARVISGAERRLIRSPLRISSGRYQMDLADLETLFSADDVKVMILCNPHNPVGRVWQQDELQTLVDLANKHNVTLISDEIHADIIYPGHRFTSLMELDAERHVSLIGSPSKTFGMQSISNGYIYTADQQLLTRMRAVSQAMYLDHGNAFTTFATIAAYQQGDDWVDGLLAYLQNNRDWISNFLRLQLPDVKMHPVEGTYQAWLDFSATGFSGERLVSLFGEAGFGASPGSWFDASAGDYARVNFAAPLADLEAAFQRLKTVLEDADRLQEPEAESDKASCC